ncbi:Hypothetical protein CAP_8842 [Chondromyces apiculatus DSM 436]|uniref:Phosphohistidine phosphatase SixA n=2 Tax=Chondromyces apiculatus TaxID=51 RepID=A0A017SVI2_9BACT|nr:Hypothetical protein CAP_8842 [Chondromyces apiculatus DSM 436]
MLTTEGRARVQEVALHLHRLRGTSAPLKILSSPLTRARQTAEIVAEVLGAAGVTGMGSSEPEHRAELALDADLDGNLRLVAEAASSGTDALLVGHAPSVDHLIRALAPGAGKNPPAAVAGGFCTAMVVALSPLDPPGQWRMTDVLDPRTFR